jgi:ribosomal protein S18 acetylase RimI-like enzyme
MDVDRTCVITPITPDDVPRVVTIHRDALSQDLLPSLGAPFLECLYRSMLDSGGVFGFVARVDEQPCGFVLATTATSGMFRTVLSRSGLALLWRVFPRILARPRVVGSLIQASLYPQQVPAVPEQAELLVIAVDAPYRRSGCGVHLVKALNAEFARRGTASYKVTVHEDNRQATRFYEKMGFTLRGRFQLTGYVWRLYTLNLAPTGL